MFYCCGVCSLIQACYVVEDIFVSVRGAHLIPRKSRNCKLVISIILIGLYNVEE